MENIILKWLTEIKRISLKQLKTDNKPFIKFFTNRWKTEYDKAGKLQKCGCIVEQMKMLADYRPLPEVKFDVE